VALVLGPRPSHADEQPRTVVSFTFDGAFADQSPALGLLQAHHMPATVYTTSARVGAPGYLGFLDLKGYAQAGMEVGGHTVDGRELTTLTAQEVRHQVCDGRVALANMGFVPRSFSYPYGRLTSAIAVIVKDCGYSNARAGATRTAGAAVQRLPLHNTYAIGALAAQGDGTWARDAGRLIAHARSSGGRRWVPLLVRHVCDGSHCPEGSVSGSALERLVTWLEDHKDTVQVTTVTGALTPSPPPSPASNRSAVTVFGVGIGQSEIVAVGLLIGTTVIVTYRVATRGNRYVSTG
jgi:peptidoglycan/xylan/chitin deacetylase (PgdA/CDA1 family)